MCPEHTRDFLYQECGKSTNERVCEKIEQQERCARGPPKPTGRLWHLETDFTEPAEPRCVLRPDPCEGSDRGSIHCTWGFVWTELNEFSDNLVFQFR